MYSAHRIEEGLPLPAARSIIERPEWSLGLMVGRSPAMQRLFSQMRSTAKHLRIATLEGEPGSGKTLAAQTLHALGSAASEPFVVCAASQFFQQAAPANSPAHVSTPALNEARNGTLFLSHVEDLTADQQARLLNLLQWLDHQQASRIQSAMPRQIFFSSRQPLRKLAASPGFRADLCHRIAAIRFVIPALREHREDIALLADYFAQSFSITHGKPLRGLGPQALPRLISHAWPGNVRELESVIHTAALDCESQWIRPIDIPALSLSLAPNNANTELAEDDPNLDRAILRHINRVLSRVEGNKLKAARMLGISRSTLYRLLESASVSDTSKATA